MVRGIGPAMPAQAGFKAQAADIHHCQPTRVVLRRVPYPPFGAAAWLLALVSRGAQIWVFGAVGRCTRFPGSAAV